MQATYSCPQCQQTNRSEVAEGDAAVECTHCGLSIEIRPGAMREGRLHRCLVCPSKDLYVRKDFPQRLGVAVVLAGMIASCIAWAYMYVIWTFAILFATALADVVLYFAVGDVLMCYRCHAQYRGAEDIQKHGSFSLETHERHRQLLARTAGDGQ